jgi:hypothetical protein
MVLVVFTRMRTEGETPLCLILIEDENSNWGRQARLCAAAIVAQESSLGTRSLQTQFEEAGDLALTWWWRLPPSPKGVRRMVLMASCGGANGGANRASTGDDRVFWCHYLVKGITTVDYNYSLVPLQDKLQI